MASLLRTLDNHSNGRTGRFGWNSGNPKVKVYGNLWRTSSQNLLRPRGCGWGARSFGIVNKL